MNDYPSQKEVDRIKKMYPKGTRILIERMNDPYHPIERGTKGTVDYGTMIDGVRMNKNELKLINIGSKITLCNLETTLVAKDVGNNEIS